MNCPYKLIKKTHELLNLSRNAPRRGRGGENQKLMCERRRAGCSVFFKSAEKKKSFGSFLRVGNIRKNPPGVTAVDFYDGCLRPEPVHVRN